MLQSTKPNDTNGSASRSFSMGNLTNKNDSADQLESDKQPATLETYENKHGLPQVNDDQVYSVSMAAALANDKQGSSSSRPRRTSTEETKRQEEPVFMMVSDPNCAAGIRRFQHFPIMRSDELPGADMDKTSLEGNNVVYLLTDSLDGTNDSGGESREDSDDLKNSSEEPTQGSVVTIFSIWNTMMGTSILAMPWALKEAGFGFGIFLIVFVASIACYTAYLAIKTTEDLKIINNISKSTFLDLSDACEYYLGKAGRIIAIAFSQISLLGAMIVYYVLLCNFLYNTGNFIYERVNGIDTSINPNATDNFTDIICESTTDVAVESALNSTSSREFIRQWGRNVGAQTTELKDRQLYDRLWSQTRTVPAWLLLILFPLISIRSPTFLGKFTALATVSVAYLFILICIKASKWGFHMDMNAVDPEHIVYNFRPTFPSLTGTCSLAFYIHNALHTIMRPQKNPEKNGRDIVIAFTFAMLTYMIIGILFFSIFPLAKSCIADNFLNNLTADIPVFIGRLALLFQMSTVFPMLVYVLRAQIMQAIFKKVYPGVLHVMVLHVILLAIGVLFAMFFPSIGTIIRYIGALCGFVYIFTLPPLITLFNKRRLGRIPVPELIETNVESGPGESPGSRPLLKIPPDFRQKTVWRDQKTKYLWWLRAVGYSIIILLGLANFIAQFVVQFLS